MKLKILKHRFIRDKAHHRTILFTAFSLLVFFDQHPSFKLGRFFLSFPESCDFEIIAQCIHSLCTHTVQSHRFLKSLAVILGAGIDLAHHIHHFSQRDTTAIITNGHRFALY